MFERRQFLISAAIAGGALIVSPALFAQAQQTLFDYQIKSRAQTDRGAPALILRAKEFIKSGKVVFKREDGKTQTRKIGRLKPGQEKRIAISQPKGTFKYEIYVEGTTQLGQTINMTLTTEVSYVDPIKLTVDREEVFVGDGKLLLGTNVALDKVVIEIFDVDGNKIIEKTQTIGGKAGKVELNWPSKSSEVGAIRLTAHDMAGFWAGVILEPFWVEIPHDDIVFDFGKSTWQKTETPKLTSTLGLVKEAMRRHKKHGLEMSMYVAGYTDTVGGPSDNIKLSRQRARALGKWFKKNGLKINIYYQGFGESVLAEQTPDNTENEKNRRAIYILGNAPPPRSSEIPKGNWQRL